MKNLLFSLPIELIKEIFEYDNSYRIFDRQEFKNEVYDGCIKRIEDRCKIQVLKYLLSQGSPHEFEVRILPNKRRDYWLTNMIYFKWNLKGVPEDYVNALDTITVDGYFYKERMHFQRIHVRV